MNGLSFVCNLAKMAMALDEKEAIEELRCLIQILDEMKDEQASKRLSDIQYGKAKYRIPTGVEHRLIPSKAKSEVGR